MTEAGMQSMTASLKMQPSQIGLLRHPVSQLRSLCSTDSTAMPQLLRGGYQLPWNQGMLQVVRCFRTSGALHYHSCYVDQSI